MWTPLSRAELDALIVGDLAACSGRQLAIYAATAIPPVKWRQSPWGDEGGGFWAVAVLGSKVLWYNDIEEGFNVSRFEEYGRIPDDGYWCNDDPLMWALTNLAAEPPGPDATPGFRR